MTDQPRGILALDVAGTLGWAYGEPSRGRPPESGSVTLAKAGSSGERFGAAAWAWMTAFLGRHPVGCVVVEEEIPASQMIGRTHQTTVRRLVGLPFVIMSCAEAHGVPRQFYANVQSVRKHFIGRGGQKSEVAKRQVANVCCALGWVGYGERHDHDRCDALAVWHFAATQLVGPESVPEVLPLFRRPTTGGNDAA